MSYQARKEGNKILIHNYQPKKKLIHKTNDVICIQYRATVSSS